MTRITIDTTDPAWAAIRAGSRWESVRREAEVGQRLGRAEGRLLWLFSDGQARTLAETADALCLEQSTVNRQVNAALKAGLLRRFRAEGRSSYLLEASRQGQEQFAHDRDRQLRLHEKALAAIPEAERAAFLEHLDRYVQAYADAVEDNPD